MSKVIPPASLPATNMSSPENELKTGFKRRSFLKGVGMAGAALSAGSLFATITETEAEAQSPKSLTAGDAAILRFVAAAELLETDLWVQYAELGGVTAGKQNPYQKALQKLDGDAAQYITSNTLDELSHAEFLNAYLLSKGADPESISMLSGRCRAVRRMALKTSGG